MAASTLSKEEQKAINKIAMLVALILSFLIALGSVFLGAWFAGMAKEQFVVNGQPTIALVLLSALIEFAMLAIVAKLLLFKLILRPTKHYQLVLIEPTKKSIGRWYLIAIGTEITASIVVTILVHVLHKDFSVSSAITLVACYLATSLTITRMIKNNRAKIQFKNAEVM